MIKVLLIDDDQVFAMTVSDHLKGLGFSVEWAYDGGLGLDLASQKAYDLLILDGRLPDMDGVEVCRRVRNELRQGMPIMFVSARSALEDRVEGLACGADDYLTKPFASAELVARLKALLRRDQKRVLEDSVLSIGGLVLDQLTREVSRDGKTIALAPTSYLVLLALMRGAPGVVTRDTIEHTVWGMHMPESDTLRSHIYNLRQRIDKPFSTPLIHTSAGKGFYVASMPFPDDVSPATEGEAAN